MFYVLGADGKSEALVGNLWTFNIWAGDNVGQAKRNGGTLIRYYYLKDHLGDTRVTINSSGTPDSCFDYYPFGQQLDARCTVGSADSRYRYTGKERDAETGYDYFGARYYDARIGRWLAVDPLAEKYADVTPYQYAHNNPISKFDLDGRADFWARELLIDAALGAVNNPNWEKRPTYIDDEGKQHYRTFCSSATIEIFQRGGDHSLDKKRANGQFQYAAKEGVSLDLNEAQTYANMGVTILVAWFDNSPDAEGHVAILTPEGIEPTVEGKGGKPLIFNVGKTNGVIGKNYGFGSRRVFYFILKKDKESADARRVQDSWWKSWAKTFSGWGKSAQEVWDEIMKR